MNDTMLVALADIPAEDVHRGRTRISPDHPLAKSHPRAFAPSKAGPPPGVRTRDLAAMGAQLSRGLERERAREREREIIANRMAQIEAEDRERESRENIYESREDRAKRQFWAETERLLRRPEPRPDPLFEIGYLLSEEERAELEQIERDWGGDRAPWNN
jgi:hypothetical protein